ncbi:MULTISPECIES: LysR family transcriptional regulator [Polaromonas]|uniref:LysR family transcriptional regulator n=1 Tax=Polaromonas aquatica TaxID=332657 RepID=A0ABW1U3E8_9BURK
MTDQRNAPRPAGVTMRQLRAFVAVAQDESITRAAQRLHLTPSALSMLISSLEGELAVRLFERTTRRIALTDAGLELLPSIKKVFENLDDAFDGLRQLSDRRSGRFAVATSPLLAATLLPPLLAGFRVRFPGIRVDLFDLPVDGIAQAVRSGQADFGVCTADTEMPGLVLTTLYQDRLMLACQSDHPLADRREVRWAELAGEPLALLRHGSGLRSLVERGFAEIGEPVQPAFEVAHVTTAVGLVEAGLAVSILPSYALSSARSPGVVAVPLTAPVMERNIVALTDGQRQLSAPCEAFLTHFKSGVTGLAASSSQKKTRKKTAGQA